MRFVALLILALLANTASLVAALDFDPKRVYQSTAPTVVLVAAFDPGQKSQSLGTGSIIRSDGLVITNAHVIFNDSLKRPYKHLRVFLKPLRITGNIRKDTSRKYKAVLVNYSTSLDLAVLKIQGRSPSFPHLQFADSNQVEIGDPVLAIGHPEQGGLWTLTTGTISSQIENFQDALGKNVFQTETSINKGNSGGPLIDLYGRMVAINSNIARRGQGGLLITDINFSIKSNVVLRWLNTIGYSFASAIPLAFEAKSAFPKPAGIVPVEEPKTLKPIPNKPKNLTEIHPYDAEDLRQQVEMEMEDMMEDMKESLQRNRTKDKKPNRINP